MIKIICVGKIKEEYFKKAILEYQKRLSKYTKLEIIEVPDCSKDSISVILNKEKEEILHYIEPKDYVITLDIEGKMYNSIELSQKIDYLLGITSNIVFVIGGSYGLHEEIKRISKESISFSKLTFPHQMFRVMLLEQIYRAYKIKNNESYHK